MTGYEIQPFVKPAKQSQFFNVYATRQPDLKIVPKPITNQTSSNSLLKIPAYLVDMSTKKNNLLYEESAVYKAIEKELGKSESFSKWFNALSDFDKRAFILYVRSNALTDNINFKQFYQSPSRFAALKVKNYLHNHKIEDLMNDYTAHVTTARQCIKLFMDKNPGLKEYLGDKFNDFEVGLFYFFMESPFTSKNETNFLSKKASEFFALRSNVEAKTQELIKQRDEKKLDMVKSNVSDASLRETVVMLFFGEVFFGVPADFMGIITQLESRFNATAKGVGSQGLTQITYRSSVSANLASSERSKIENASGLKIQSQFVTMGLVSQYASVNVLEGIKTVILKCGDLKINTRDLALKWDKKADHPANLKVFNLRGKVAGAYNGNLNIHPNQVKYPGKSIMEVYLNNAMMWSKYWFKLSQKNPILHT